MPTPRTRTPTPIRRSTVLRPALFSLVLWGVVALAVAVPALAGPPLSADAGRFVRDTVAAARTQLGDPALDEAERRARFRILLRERFALEQAAMQALGRYRDRATPAQLEEYVALYEDLTVERLYDPFMRYVDRRFDVDGVNPTPDGAAFIVQSAFSAGRSQGIDVVWRVVRGSNEELRVADLEIYGISYAELQRAEFTAVIRANDNQVGALIDRLRVMPNG